MPRIRMSDADRERYGGPEWVEISLVELIDEETGLIEQVENAWGMSPPELLRHLFRQSTQALRAVVWIARRKAGCVDPVATFKPKVQAWSGITWEPLPAEVAAAEEATAEWGDADPPANRAERRKKPGRRPAKSKTSSTSTGSTSSGS